MQIDRKHKTCARAWAIWRLVQFRTFLRPQTRSDAAPGCFALTAGGGVEGPGGVTVQRRVAGHVPHVHISQRVAQHHNAVCLPPPRRFVQGTSSQEPPIVHRKTAFRHQPPDLRLVSGHRARLSSGMGSSACRSALGSCRIFRLQMSLFGSGKDISVFYGSGVACIAKGQRTECIRPHTQSVGWRRARSSARE